MTEQANKERLIRVLILGDSTIPIAPFIFLLYRINVCRWCWKILLHILLCFG